MKGPRIKFTAACECGWTYWNWVQSDVMDNVKHHRRTHTEGRNT